MGNCVILPGMKTKTSLYIVQADGKLLQGLADAGLLESCTAINTNRKKPGPKAAGKKPGPKPGFRKKPGPKPKE
jgi:hypothetical protein